MSQLLALTIYAILLMPGFIQVGYYYFFSSQVRRSIVYGEQPRNRLDLYIPEDNSRPCPVVAFVTGGAWIIGYKAWGALLGRRLAERGIIVACIDYRNFPQGTIGDMVNDASQGISFVCNNIANYGGDPNQIYLMGQSAGAHIAACALMEQAVKESGGHPVSWSVTQIKAYFGLSGGYNIHSLVDHFHERGLYRSIFLSIMEGEESLSRYSPEIIAKTSSAETIALLPLIVLMHGTGDYSIPSSASQTFVDVLHQVGAQARLLLYEGKTHTDIFLQDPLRGGRDPLVEDVLSVIHADDAIARQKVALAPTPRRLVFEWQLKLARQISPF
ncbi:probable isoprenylcysteine alpha-carbonyl methylesterase ICME isoform X3 [Setaria viridis]|nr:probable isoprenylcysteine alpha-carbonyl methylesterase ICME isoform X2 [Setaria viridis]